MQEAENTVSCDIDWTLKWDGARHVRKVAEKTKRGDEFPLFSTNVVLSHLTLRRDHTCRKKGSHTCGRIKHAVVCPQHTV